MRKIFNKVVASVVTTAMVAGLVVATTPAKVSAAVKLGTWDVYQSGDVPSNWDPGDFSQFDSIEFSNGQKKAKNELEVPKLVNGEVIGGTTATGISADGFVADILSNGWQAAYPYSNNPWSLRLEMGNIGLVLGERYELSFDAFCESTDFAVKYAKINVIDSDTNVYLSKTIEIGKSSTTFKFNVDVLQQPNVQLQIMLGAFPVADYDKDVNTAEANWKGKVSIQNINFTDKGKSPDYIEPITVKFVNDGKTVATHEMQPGEKTIPAISAKKKGYTLDGWYNGTSKFNFAVAPTKGGTYTAKWTKVSAPKKAKISSLKSSKSKTLTVSMKKASGVKGFSIQYSTSKKFKKAKSTSTTSTKKTIKKLSRGKKYYVRIKAYKVDSTGAKISSKKWSKAKSAYVR